MTYEKVTIERDKDYFKITNDSFEIVYIGNVPIAPKRKLIDCAVVYSKEFMLLDHNIELGGLYIRFENLKKHTGLDGENE